MIWDRLNVAQSRKKDYAECRVHALIFGVGHHVFFCESPMKVLMRFDRKRKLSPIYIRPFEIPRVVGEEDYELYLPPNLPLFIWLFISLVCNDIFPIRLICLDGTKSSGISILT